MVEPEADSRATKASLLLRIRDAGDSSSWEDFTEVYAPIIRGYCRRRHLQDADAADVCQEVLAQVARSIGTFAYEPGRGRFRDWLGTVTRRKIIRHQEVRARGGRPVGGDPAAEFEVADSTGEDPEWSAEFHARILEVALARIRGDFEAPTWTAFERVWGEDRPAPDVARALGMTIDSVYAAKSRVLKRLRAEILILADDLPMT